MTTNTEKPGPWRLHAPYGICKGNRLVLEGDGSTTTDERQSIVDSLNRDYANESLIAERDALDECDALRAEVARLREWNCGIATEIEALREALNEMHANTENRQDEPFIAYIRRTCAAALAAGSGK